MLKPESLPIAQIYVSVKRRGTFNPAVVRKIAESMLEIGQQEPILVRRDGERFVLVDGLHRLEACKALGEETVLGLFVPAQATHQRALPPYEAEIDALRQKTARLRQLRLSKEAAERSSSVSLPTPLEEATTTGVGQRPSRSGDISSQSKSATLLEWLAERERDGFRT
jgi:hypothetical protein